MSPFNHSRSTEHLSLWWCYAYLRRKADTEAVKKMQHLRARMFWIKKLKPHKTFPLCDESSWRVKDPAAQTKSCIKLHLLLEISVIMRMAPVATPSCNPGHNWQLQTHLRLTVWIIMRFRAIYAKMVATTQTTGNRHDGEVEKADRNLRTVDFGEEKKKDCLDFCTWKTVYNSLKFPQEASEFLCVGRNARRDGGFIILTQGETRLPPRRAIKACRLPNNSGRAWWDSKRWMRRVLD